MLKTRLKESRERLGLTQKEIAQIFNIHESTVSGWETGKDPIPFRKLLKYCDLFNYSIDYILKLNDENIKNYSNTQTEARTIGVKLRQIRIKNNHSQEDVAKLLNISQSCYSNYEQGRELITTLAVYTMAKIYNFSIDKLVGRKQKIEVTL